MYTTATLFTNLETAVSFMRSVAASEAEAKLQNNPGATVCTTLGKNSEGQMRVFPHPTEAEKAGFEPIAQAINHGEGWEEI